MLALGTLLTDLVDQLRRAIQAHAVELSHVPQPVQLGVRSFVPRLPAHLVPTPRLPRLGLPVWSLLCLRLGRIAFRLARLHAQWQQGTLPRPRTQSAPRTPVVVRTRTATRSASALIPASPLPGAPLVPPPVRLPRGQGWVTRRIPQAIPCAGWLNELVNAAHTRDFIAAAPQAARLLRPLCAALGIAPPPWLALPPRAPTPRPPKPRRPRPMRLTDPALGLQPWVIRAVRASRRKYGRD